MPHPLITQLRFTRSEFRRGLEGLSEADAQTRVGKMNCISWNVGHLAWQEQRYWLFRMQDTILLPDVKEKFAYGAPGFTPPLAETWAAYDAIIAAVDPFLDTLVTDDLQKHILLDGGPDFVTPGNMLLRVIYHYWYHTGENLAIRQALGHTGLPDFVGNIDEEAPYEPH